MQFLDFLLDIVNITKEDFLNYPSSSKQCECEIVYRMCVNRSENELSAVDFITFSLNVLGLNASEYYNLPRCSYESESSVLRRLWVAEQEWSEPVVLPNIITPPPPPERHTISPIKITRSSPNWSSRYLIRVIREGA